DPVVPDDLHQRAGAAPEHEQIAAVRIALQTLLDQQRQARHPLAHVGVAHRDPHPHARGDHRSAFRAAVTCPGDAAAKMLTRLPRARSTTIAGWTAAVAVPSPSTIRASAKPGPGNASGLGSAFASRSL